MTLHTVEVGIRPEDALRVMTELEGRTEPWGFTPEGSGTFRAWQDGTDGPINIRLHPDGTWEAFTHVVLGEKQA